MKMIRGVERDGKFFVEELKELFEKYNFKEAQLLLENLTRDVVEKNL
jgi:hypothetical protein